MNGDWRRGNRAAAREPGRRLEGRAVSTVLALGLGASILAGVVMLVALAAIGEIAAEPTPVSGIDSSSWTPITGITSFFFGLDAFHGGFAPPSILFGLLGHLLVAVAFGLVGTWFILVTQGLAPGALGAAIQGLAYALFVEVYFLNLVVGALQDVHSVYESIPQWGWWVAHAAYGVSLGLAVSAAARSGRPDGASPAR